MGRFGFLDDEELILDIEELEESTPEHLNVKVVPLFYDELNSFFDELRMRVVDFFVIGDVRGDFVKVSLFCCSSIIHSIDFHCSMRLLYGIAQNKVFDRGWSWAAPLMMIMNFQGGEIHDTFGDCSWNVFNGFGCWDGFSRLGDGDVAGDSWRSDGVGVFWIIRLSVFLGLFDAPLRVGEVPGIVFGCWSFRRLGHSGAVVASLILVVVAGWSALSRGWLFWFPQSFPQACSGWGHHFCLCLPLECQQDDHM